MQAKLTPQKMHWVISFVISTHECLCNCAARLHFVLLTVRTSQTAQWESFLVSAVVSAVPAPKLWQISV